MADGARAKFFRIATQVYADQDIGSHILERRERQIFREASVDVEFALDLDWGEIGGDARRRPHGVEH